MGNQRGLRDFQDSEFFGTFRRTRVSTRSRRLFGQVLLGLRCFLEP